MKRHSGAVAVDLGAGSARYAEGWIEEGKLRFSVVRQTPHQPKESGSRLEWDLDALVGLTREAVAHAEGRFESATLGIDSWGVDHGFLAGGNLAQPVVCYRDRSHERVFQEAAERRSWLYGRTGIQHQPFNTVYQLIARRQEDPSLPSRAEWRILPDLLGALLARDRHHELTEASTTQLMGLDGQWDEEVFRWIGWPVPKEAPTAPGTLGPSLSPSVRLARVGSHDTASAVIGLGRLDPEDLFLNVGTWSLAGKVYDQPCGNLELAEKAALTHERSADGRFRVLANIPGFYVINRLHEELQVEAAVPDWLASARPFDALLDLMRPEFFNPDSMLDLCRSQLTRPPQAPEEWAYVALRSLAEAVRGQIGSHHEVTGTGTRRIRVGGGGSQSVAFCQMLAEVCRVPVWAGPAEATLAGNLGAQFLASGALSDWGEVADLMDRSSAPTLYEAAL